MTVKTKRFFLYRRNHYALLQINTAQGTEPIFCEIAEHFWTRASGLLFSQALPPQQGLLLPNCRTIHTMAMRFPIDIVYLKRKNLHSELEIIECVAALKPWRISSCPRPKTSADVKQKASWYTLELAAGTIDKFGILRKQRCTLTIDA